MAATRQWRPIDEQKRPLGALIEAGHVDAMVFVQSYPPVVLLVPSARLEQAE